MEEYFYEPEFFLFSTSRASLTRSVAICSVLKKDNNL